ncbi:Peptidyl-prolyl cis-trans isomerase CYP18-1, partial [Bienertia sinuspersici]
MIQGGDPTGTCKGGTSEELILLYPISFLQHNARGTMSMANSGANTNGSQFFIAYAKQPHLNGLYTVFGKVIHGFEFLDHMEKTISLYTYKATITKAQTYTDTKD